VATARAGGVSDSGEGGDLERVAGWIGEAAHVVALTGAGVSTASGIPDFRGPQGLWTRDPDAVRMATIDSYVGDAEVRRAAWRWRCDTRVSRLEPNPAHLALAELERDGRLDLVITQNVDGLHQRAGSSPDRVVEVHGTSAEVGCLACAHRWPADDILDRVEAGDPDPTCDRCGGMLKSATVSFGQALDPDDLERADRGAREADVLIAAGTTLGVYPVAAVPAIAAQHGARVVIVNGEPTEQDDLADVVLRGRTDELLPSLAAAVRGR
jgi:NAD-dependent deacetylase